MRLASTVLSAFFAAVGVTLPGVSANMQLLLSIRQRLDTLIEDGEITSRQYEHITSLASKETLDADYQDHDMNYVRPPLSEKNADDFRGWIDSEEDEDNMTSDTVDYIRNIFDLGDSPDRATEVSRSQHNGPVPGDYEGNGIVKFLGRSGTFAKGTNRLYNGIWGYTKGRREYALQCNSIGLNIIDITDKPAAGSNYPVIQTITMSGGDTWRDVATEGDYAYVAAQGGSNPDAFVVNLGQLSGGDPQAPLSNPITTNNIKNLGYSGQGHTMNVGLGLLFYNNARGGCITFSLEDPMSPRLLGTINTGDCHDSYAQNIGGKDILFSSDGYKGKWSVVDITDMRNTKTFKKLGQTAVQSGAYAHQGITSEDGKTLFVCEEFNKFDMAAYDVTDLTKPTLISKFQWSGEVSEGNSKVHNGGAVVGDYLIVAYYNAGLRVFDISNVNEIKEVGKYETYRDPDGDGNNNNKINGSYTGGWNVAALPSGKILVSDSKYATFVVELETGSSAPTKSALPTHFPTTKTPTKTPTMAPTVPTSSFGPTPQSYGTGEPTGAGETKAPTKSPSASPSAAPTPNENVCDGKNKKECKKEKETCVFGKSKIFGACAAKKSKYKHDCAQYDNEQACADEEYHEGLCKFDDGSCAHVCEGLEKKPCMKFKNTDDGKKTCKPPKLKNPCKGCMPKSKCAQ